MQRRYYRQFENYDTVVPRLEDFPVLGAETAEANEPVLPVVSEEKTEISSKNSLFGLQLDDIIIIAVIILLLMEEEKDLSAIAVLGLLFLSGYLT